MIVFSEELKFIKIVAQLEYKILTLISLNILPIRKTRTTLKRVGDIGKSIIMSSITMPKIEANTRRKSNTFHGTVK